MNRNVFISSLLAVCVACATTSFSAETKPFVFRGVEPGVTTESELLKNDRWGKPTKRETRNDGSAWLEFRVRGYKGIGVLIRGGKVQTIDVALPDGLKPAAVASALKLGEPAADDTLPPAAMAGPAIPSSYDTLSFADRRVALFVDRESGDARLLRVFAENMNRQTVSKPVLPDLPAPEGETPVASGALTGQNAANRQIVSAVTKLLPKYHLSRHPVDDEIARRTLKGFLTELDPLKIYFNQDDVVPFVRRYDELDDQLRGGDLSMAYDIFERYLERVRERVALIKELLEEEHDFTVDEVMETDAATTAYAENDLEVREIWRKRVKYQLLVHKAAGADEGEARRRVGQRYRNYLQTVEQMDDDDLRDTVLNSLALSYDPHSSYLSPRKYADFQISTAAKLFGFGAALQTIDGYVTVQRIIPDGPAARDGRLKQGDRILAVGQGDDGEMADVINVKLADAVSQMRGADGTILRLRILPEGEFESTVYKLKRGKVVVQSIGHAVLSGENLPDGRTAKVGFIYLPTFYLDMAAQQAKEKDFRSTTRDMRQILADFKKQNVDAVVIDMRNNGGGSLTEAVNLIGLFIDGGPLGVQVKGQDGKVLSYAAQGTKSIWNGPLTILTSKMSAGGAEIVAGAMQDYRRSLIIGDSKTHGLGTVASAHDIGAMLFGNENPPKLGYVKLVIQKYYRPSGESMQLRGILPDAVLPSPTERMKIGEDLLAYALKFDRVAAGQYAKSTDFPLDDTVRKSLIDRSEARRTGSPYFQRLASQWASASSDSGVVPLHEEQYLARQKQLADQSDPPPNVPDIPDVKLDGYLNEALAISLDYVSRVSLAHAEKLYADKQYSRAMDRYRVAAAADPNFTTARYKYAWVLSTCPQAQSRNGKLAVTHAQKACELDEWKSWHSILALALAEAEAGDFSGAQEHLKTALEKAPQDQQATYRFLQQRFEQGQPYQSR